MKKPKEGCWLTGHGAVTLWVKPALEAGREPLANAALFNCNAAQLEENSEQTGLSPSWSHTQRSRQAEMRLGLAHMAGATGTAVPIRCSLAWSLSAPLLAFSFHKTRKAPF